ncbi:unnamed protein product, partial [Closterium sp. NIES-54]
MELGLAASSHEAATAAGRDLQPLPHLLRIADLAWLHLRKLRQGAIRQVGLRVLHLQQVELLLRGDSLALAFRHAMARGWRVNIGIALLLSLRAVPLRERGDNHSRK